MLNPAWQSLPAAQKVVVKPYRFRAVQLTPYNGTVDEGKRQAFTVLLSGPQARFGTVVATALRVPWQ